MRFWKYHGIGNDFVIVDLRPARLYPEAARIREICHRRRGVGADGVLAIGPSDLGLVAMKVFNADASVAEMCGNGIRCVARFLADHGGVQENPIAIETDSGVRACTLLPDGEVVVEMGPAIDLGVLTLNASGLKVSGRHINVGNPHFVVFEPHAGNADELGPSLCVDPVFPEGANISFVRLTGPATAAVRVWERGSGWTQACGTAACATVAAMMLERRIDDLAAEVCVALPGGSLKVGGRLDALTMQGEAVEVFTGDGEF